LFSDLKVRVDLDTFTRDQLLEYIELLSKNWLAHDGCWFLSIEKELGIEQAIDYDVASWTQFSAIEAQKIKEFLHLSDHPGIPGLIAALKLRLYANINIQEIIEVTKNSCVFRMNACRVQTARTRKNLPDFPCKQVGVVEYSVFARTIDNRIKTECIVCPPENHPKEYYCAWKFTVDLSIDQV
jgi:hypothetical protein